MRKLIDITEKLELGENPCLVIKGEEIEFNADAATVLKLTGLSTDGDQSDESIANRTLRMYDLLFPEKSQKQIEKMRLSLGDLSIAIETAMNFIRGGNEPEGEVQTHTTT